MEYNYETFKRDAKIILELQKVDTQKYFDFIFEDKKLSIVNNLEKHSNHISTEDFIYVRCIRYMLQMYICYAYYFIPVIELVLPLLPEDFQAEDEELPPSPHITSNEFYKLLTLIEDEHVRETIKRIHCVNKQQLFDELYEAVCNRDIQLFIEVLMSHNADFTFAAQYLRSTHIKTKMILDITSSFKNEDTGMQERLFEYYNNKCNSLSYIDYDFNKYTNEDCSELEYKVSIFISFCKRVIQEINEDKPFKIKLDRITHDKYRNWIQYCFQDILDANEESFFDEFAESSQLYKIQQILYLNKPKQETLICNYEDSLETEIFDNYNDEDKITKTYCKLLSKSKLLNKKLIINVLCTDYLVNRIMDGNNRIDEIKYVFFRRGSEPKNKLVWTSEKQDIACLMRYIFKRKTKEIWKYLDKYIVDIDGAALFAEVVNPSSSAKDKPYEKFKKEIETLLNNRYTKSSILNDII